MTEFFKQEFTPIFNQTLPGSQEAHNRKRTRQSRACLGSVAGAPSWDLCMACSFFLGPREWLPVETKADQFCRDQNSRKQQLMSFLPGVSGKAVCVCLNCRGKPCPLAHPSRSAPLLGMPSPILPKAILPSASWFLVLPTIYFTLITERWSTHERPSPPSGEGGAGRILLTGDTERAWRETRLTSNLPLVNCAAC